MNSGFLLVLFLVGLVSCHHERHHGWKNGVQYQYEMRGRNVVGLHQVSNQFVGLLTKGLLNIQPRSNGRVNVKIQQAEHMDLHAKLPRGWRTFVPDDASNYSPLPLQTNSFDLEFKGGVVNKMWVHKAAPVHEINILKAIASLLQIDTTGVNMKNPSSSHPSTPENRRFDFVTMEDTVNGEVETQYNISPLPQYYFQTEPSLARLPEGCPQSTFLSVEKTLDFSKPHHLPIYNYGFDDLPNGIVGGNNMGHMLSRASNTRSVICGDLEHFLVQSAVTTDKIVVAPHLYNEQKGIVASQFNLTLIAAGESKEEPATLPSDAQEYSTLQYLYNPAGSSEETRSPRSKRSAKQDQSGRNDLEHGKVHDFDNDSKDRQSPKSSKGVHFHEKPEAKHNSGRSNDSDSGEITPKRKNGIDNTLYNTKKTSHESKKNSSDSNDSNSDSSSSSSSSSDSDSSSSSFSMSSEEKYWQPRPSLKSAPNSPLLPFFIGYSGNSIQASKLNAVETVHKLAAYVALNMADRNSLNPQNALTAFSRLVSLLQTMNEEQMRQSVAKLYTAYTKASQSSQSHANQYAAWIALRDAIAQAGSGPALLTLQSMMKMNMVEGEEAAELIAATSKMAQFPSEEYMEMFFNMMQSEEVSRHNFLNVSTVMSFAGLVRRVFVSNETTIKNYPVYSFGLPHSSKSKVVQDKYLPHFKSKLEEAIKHGDSPSIQLYIRALGETSHPSVLDIFEPYLQGSKSCSAFQRLSMIVSLSEMAKIYPKFVRPVMFKIYQNTGEKPEIRVASIMQLMKTNPPAQLLQRIAQMTNCETSKQVNSAVKSAIESAARDLQTNEDRELAESARSAVDILTKYEYGMQYSKVFLSSWEKENVHLGYLHQLSHIQSEDNVFPSSIFCNMKRRLGGFENPSTQMSFSTSSFSNLMSLISSQTAKRINSSSIPESNGDAWHYEKIDKLLNLSEFLEEQVEGNIVATVFGTKRLFAFDNHTINRLPQYAHEAVDKIRTPKPFNMTKMYDQLNLKIAFPTAMGLPFSYIFSVPTVVQLGGQVEGKVFPDPSRAPGPMPLPRTVNITGDVNFMYSAMSEGKMSFVTPFNHREYSTGLRRNVQIRLPLSLHADVDLDNTKVRWVAGPLEPKKMSKIFEYSTVPYTAIQNLLEVVDPSINERIINVRRTKKVMSPVSIMGLALDVSMETQQKYLSWSNVYYAVRNHNYMTALMYPFAEEAINFNNFTLVYNGPKSSTARVLGALKYNKQEDDRDNETPIQSGKTDKSPRGPSQSATDPKVAMDAIDTGFDSHERELRMLNMATSGIKNATSSILDLSVALEGSGKQEVMTATVAVGSSRVANSSLMVAFSSFGGDSSSKSNYKMYAVANVSSPLLHVTNFEKTLSENTNMTMNGALYFGNKENMSNLKWKMFMWKSDERKAALKNKPLARVCLEQMKKGYWVQPSCRNVTGQSGHMDSYNVTMVYDNVPDTMKTATWIAYTIGRYYVTDYMSEQLVGEAAPSGSSGRLAVQWKVASKALNISISSPAIEANFTGIPLNPTVAKALTIHPTYSVVSRVASKLTRNQFFPICAVEGEIISTFDNQTYPYKLGTCWHAMTHSTPKVFKDHTIDRPSNYSVLVRKTSSDNNKKEVMMVLDNNVIHLHSNQSLSWNGKSVLMSSNRINRFWDANQNEVAIAYLLPGNMIVVEAPRHHMKVLYDGARVLLQLANSQRGAVRGICGNFNGEKIDDFLTSRNCVQANPQTFASHYSVPSDSCNASSSGRARNGNNSPSAEYDCVPWNVFRGRPIEEEMSSHAKIQSANRRKPNHSSSRRL